MARVTVLSARTQQQLALIDTPTVPKLTVRQQRVLELVRQAGPDGVHADEIGAALHEEREGRWQHSRDDRCLYCASTGKEVLGALKKKGLVRYRRARSGMPGYWQAVDATDTRPLTGMLAATEPLPF